VLLDTQKLSGTVRADMITKAQLVWPLVFCAR
jgi:hypothetical protein